MKSHSRSPFLFLQSSYSVQFAEVLFSVFYTLRGLMHVKKRIIHLQGQIRLVRSFIFGHQYPCFLANMKDSEWARINASNSPDNKGLKISWFLLSLILQAKNIHKLKTISFGKGPVNILPARITAAFIS